MKSFPIAGIVVLASTVIARAEVVTYDISGTVANTLTKLGSQFVLGCAILAAGIAGAAFISKKK